MNQTEICSFLGQVGAESSGLHILQVPDRPDLLCNRFKFLPSTVTQTMSDTVSIFNSFIVPSVTRVALAVRGENRGFVDERVREEMITRVIIPFAIDYATLFVSVLGVGYYAYNLTDNLPVIVTSVLVAKAVLNAGASIATHI